MIDLHYWPRRTARRSRSCLRNAVSIPDRAVQHPAGRPIHPEFLQMNPNHRMPVMVDHDPKGGGAPISVFESGAIMMYIAEKVGGSGAGSARQICSHEWLTWQMANQGPKLGECGHFRRAGPEAGDLTYAINRFTDEANRLYGSSQPALSSKYVAGDEYTIADMISYPWTVNWKAQGQDIDEFKYFKRWFDELGARPAVQRAWRSAPTCRPTRQACPTRNARAIVSGCTTSAPCRCRVTSSKAR